MKHDVATPSKPMAPPSQAAPASPTAPAAPALPPGYENALGPGTRVGGHVIDSVLAVGEFGIVYHAVDPMLRRAVALKEFFAPAFCVRNEDGIVSPATPQDEKLFATGRQAFLEEARLLAHLEVPGLLPVTGLFEDRGTVYRVMPFAPGRTLASWRALYTDTMDEGALRHLLSDLMAPLEALHAANLVHGYVLPEQVMLAEGRPALLLGFGTVRRTLQAALDPAYTPIEQLPSGGHLPRGAWSDIYALAALGRFAMAPSPTRASQEPPTAHALRARAPIGHALAHALEGALSPQPGDRPQSVAAMRTAMGLRPSAAHSSSLDLTLPGEHIDMTATRPWPRSSMPDIARLPRATPSPQAHAPTPSSLPARAGGAAPAHETVRASTPTRAWADVPPETDFAPLSQQADIDLPSSPPAPAPATPPAPVPAPQPSPAPAADAAHASPVQDPIPQFMAFAGSPDFIEPRYGSAASSAATGWGTLSDIYAAEDGHRLEAAAPDDPVIAAETPAALPEPPTGHASVDEAAAALADPAPEPFPDATPPAAAAPEPIEPAFAEPSAQRSPGTGDEPIDDAVRAAIAAAIGSLPPAPPRRPVTAQDEPPPTRIDFPPFEAPSAEEEADDPGEQHAPIRAGKRPSKAVLAAAIGGAVLLVLLAVLAWSAWKDATTTLGKLGAAGAGTPCCAAPAAVELLGADRRAGLSPPGASAASRRPAAA